MKDKFSVPAIWLMLIWVLATLSRVCVVCIHYSQWLLFSVHQAHHFHQLTLANSIDVWWKGNKYVLSYMSLNLCHSAPWVKKKKHHKSSWYNSYALFQVFWSHTLCVRNRLKSRQSYHITSEEEKIHAIWVWNNIMVSK